MKPALRSRLVLAVGGLLLAAAIGTGALVSHSEADHPTEADLIAQRCQGFSKASIWLAYTRGFADLSYKYLLHAHQDGRLAADSVAGSRGRVYWDGQQLTRSTAANPGPRTVTGFDQIIADIWTECRSGFDDSTWSTVAIPVADVPHLTRYWLRLELPYDWADQVQVLVGYMPGSGELMQLVLLEADGTVIQSVRLEGENWTASFPDQALGRDVPPFFPPKYPEWTQYDFPSQEILDGADPDDLLIPVSPPPE